jgi:2-dehydropantoate 2-reductase
VIGKPDGGLSARAQRVAEVFNGAGLDTNVSRNITGVIWDKLLVNVATGALSAITRLSYGPLYQSLELQATATAAVAEAMAVAQASGIRLSITDPAEPWRLAGAGLPPEFKPSMLQSLEKGSITEIDFINGAVVREGEKVGVATPVNRTLVACIKGLERGL